MAHPDFASINTDFLPKPYAHAQIAEEFASLDNTFGRQLVESISGSSPYLAKLINSYPQVVHSFLQHGADSSFAQLPEDFSTQSEADLMRDLRRYKQRAALLIALADVSECWNLQQVTNALSSVARTTLQASLNYLIGIYQRQHGLQIKDPENGNGIIVLAMGKLGAQELNYSSDVDLILLYEGEKLSLAADKPIQRVLNRLTQDLVRLMQQRTADGYVFRMDLRLRPDPSSTPLILNTEAAFRYYESVGQNWERAAFIKASPIAGDIAAGKRFLTRLKPFIWRKSLDFAAINDIKSIKRQMDRSFQNLEIEIPGYDLKKGLGGIREIEFLAQIHQLIWGGRHRELRSRRTLETYQILQEMDLLTEDETQTLMHNYTKLRQFEHRLQMLYDEQTHSLPNSAEERERLACFCGYNSREEFENDVAELAVETHKIYHECFNEENSLAGDGKLSFTGVTQDPETLRTLQQMGFQNAELVYETIQSWHRGSIAAMQSARARELLTELTPSLLAHIAQQDDADAAFRRFSRFFSRLPAGVTLLSLLYNNQELLQTFIHIIGNAPQLAHYLGQHPDWLDALLTLGHEDVALNEDTLHTPHYYRQMSHQPDEAASWLCRYRCEHEFVMGCQLLAGILDPLAAMPILTHIADTAIGELSQNVINSFEEQYGSIENSSFHIVALGRLGSKELTFGSDLDLLFLYSAPEESVASNGKRSLGVSAYYNRLAQRIIGQLTAMTPEGRLYEVDDRLRPAGKDGPLAVSLQALQKYYEENAWIFERMALLRHRVVFDSATTTESEAEKVIRSLLLQAQDKQKITHDALEMRQRLWQEFPPDDGWNLKHAQGGLIDLTFILQTLILQHVNSHPQLVTPAPEQNFSLLAEARLITQEQAETLHHSLRFQQRVQTVLRLCHRQYDETKFSMGLKQTLCKVTGLQDFAAVRQHLHQHQKASYTIFVQMIGDYT